MFRHVLAAAVALTVIASFADTAANTRPVTVEARFDEVVVKSPKHAAMMPYDDVYVRLKRMQDSKLDRVRMQIKVTPKDESVKLADIRVAIVNDNISLPVPLAADGTVNLPLRPDLYRTDAEIRTNQPKGALTGSLSLGVAWSGGNAIPYSEIEETVRQIQTAGKDLMGWVAYMIFFPSLGNFEVPVQYPSARGQTMTVMKDGRAIETYTADDKGLLRFRLKPAWAQLQPTLVFSETPPKP